MDERSQPLQELRVSGIKKQGKISPQPRPEPKSEPEPEPSSSVREMDDVFNNALIASKEGRAILKQGSHMALKEKAIIRGSCWDWINTVFHRAGFANNNHIVFKGKKNGPYVNNSKIRPGDWLYYVNHSYKRVGHSGIFVRWVDFDKKIGMILSYAGEGRKKPGRYKAYNLKDVYFIKRPGNPSVAQQLSSNPPRLTANGSS